MNEKDNEKTAEKVSTDKNGGAAGSEAAPGSAQGGGLKETAATSAGAALEKANAAPAVAASSEAVAADTGKEEGDAELVLPDWGGDGSEAAPGAGKAAYRSRLKKGLATFAALAAIIVAGVLAYAYFGIINSGDFIKGTSIGGVSVAGMSPDEAVPALESQLKGRLNDDVVFFKDSYTYDERLSRVIEPIDYKTAVQDAWAAEQERSWQNKLESVTGDNTVNYSLGISIKKDIEAELTEEWDKKWSEAAVDASLDLNDSGQLVVLPEKEGKKVDTVATFEQLRDAMFGSGPLKFAIIIVDEKPKITEKDLEGMHELASYTSEYDTGLENRSHNLELATSKIDNAKLEPGQEFSFNETVGERTSAAGYLDALIFVGNQVEPGLGGGVCQVASTLYNTVLLSGLEIVERWNHNLPITYVPLGRDATVTWGSMDFRFKNNTDSVLYIAAQAGGGSVTISIYGKCDVPHIEVGSETHGSTGYATVEKLDPTLPPGTRKVETPGSSGYYASAWRIFYDENGNVTKREELGQDTYNGKDEVVLVGPPLNGQSTVPSDPNNPNSTSNPGSPNAANTTGTNSTNNNNSSSNNPGPSSSTTDPNSTPH